MWLITLTLDALLPNPFPSRIASITYFYPMLNNKYLIGVAMCLSLCENHTVWQKHKVESGNLEAFQMLSFSSFKEFIIFLKQLVAQRNRFRMICCIGTVYFSKFGILV